MADANVTANEINYSGEGDAKEIRDFLFKTLADQGWKVDESEKLGDQNSKYFAKNGFRIYASINNYSGNLMVTVINQGNFRSEWLPRPATADNQTESYYRAKGSISELEAFFYREMVSRGWQIHTRLDSAGSEEPDDRRIEFRKNGILAYVTISNPSADKGEYAVQHYAELLDKELPTPNDVQWIEFDSMQPNMVCTSAQDLPDVAHFYEQSMPGFGYQVLSTNVAADHQTAELSFQGEDGPLNIQLSRFKDRTLIRCGDVSNATCWTLQMVDGLESAVINAVDSTSATASIEAADFPIPDGATNVVRDRDFRQIKFDTKQKPDEVAKFYLEQLKSLGWKESDNNLIESDFARVGWKKDDVEIRMNASQWGQAILGGNGLAWKKAIPEDQYVVSYETWLKRQGALATLDRLDEFEAEMQRRAAAN